jgi:hypothetical protein
MCTVNKYFTFDQRLKINVPVLLKEWFTYSPQTQELILLEWERIRGAIPDRIGEIEKEIKELQSSLGQEEDFEESCRLNSEISERASEINDLWIWYRTAPDIQSSTR